MLQKLTAQDFESIYQLMDASFPSTEHRVKEDQRALFDTESAYCVLGKKSEFTGKLEGFLAVWEFEDLLFVEHFAVDPALRGNGYGSRLLTELAKSTDKTICLEVEPPENDLAKRRIAFYERNGFFLNEYPYIQPSMAVGEPPIPLLIMTYGQPINQTRFKAIREELYRKVYHTEAMPC